LGRPWGCLISRRLDCWGWDQPKGSSFTGEDKDFFKFRVGDKTVIPAFEEAIADMRVGGIRRIIVPEELGYPDNDFSKGVGPAPLTFAVRLLRLPLILLFFFSF
jgi:FKBP-type peptidyl-prolyl cis-trans isomerase